MRARKVHEGINFERGQDPKSSMGIGKIQDLKKIDQWVNSPDWIHYYRAIDDGNYEGSIVVVYESIDATPTHYSAVTMDPDGRIREGNFVESPELAWKDAKQKIDMENHRIQTGYYDAMIEAVNFVRGQDPKAAMGIGVKDRMPEVIFQAALDSDYVTYDKLEDSQIIFSITTRGSKIILSFTSIPIKNIWTGRNTNKLKAAEEIIKDAGLENLFKYFSYSPNSSTDVVFFLKEGEFKEGAYEPYEFGLDGK